MSPALKNFLIVLLAVVFTALAHFIGVIPALGVALLYIAFIKTLELLMP